MNIDCLESALDTRRLFTIKSIIFYTRLPKKTGKSLELPANFQIKINSPATHNGKMVRLKFMETINFSIYQMSPKNTFSAKIRMEHISVHKGMVSFELTSPFFSTGQNIDRQLYKRVILVSDHVAYTM